MTILRTHWTHLLTGAPVFQQADTIVMDTFIFLNTWDRRVGSERRLFSYSEHIPERRSGEERRSGIDRRARDKVRMAYKLRCKGGRAWIEPVPIQRRLPDE